MAVADAVNARTVANGRHAAGCNNGGCRVVDVDQVQVTGGRCGNRFASAKFVDKRNSSRPINARKPQDHRVHSQGMCGQHLLGRKRCQAAVAARIGRRKFIDPFTMSWPVNAGRADVDEPLDTRWQSVQDVLDSAGIHLVNRLAARSIVPDCEQDAINFSPAQRRNFSIQGSDCG